MTAPPPKQARWKRGELVLLVSICVAPLVWLYACGGADGATASTVGLMICVTVGGVSNLVIGGGLVRDLPRYRRHWPQTAWCLAMTGLALRAAWYWPWWERLAALALAVVIFAHCFWVSKTDDDAWDHLADSAKR